MPGKTTIAIRGAREMERLLKELGPRTANRVGRTAVRAGAKVVADEARRLVPVRTGALRDSIAVKAESYVQSEQQVTAQIGFLKPHSRRAHLTEFGTAHSAAHPFIRPAMDAKASEALDRMGEVLARGITRAAKKLAKP